MYFHLSVISALQEIILTWNCGFQVKLEDVLACRHLPPLTLKEFEEYLNYVEHAPENL